MRAHQGTSTPRPDTNGCRSHRCRGSDAPAALQPPSLYLPPETAQVTGERLVTKGQRPIPAPVLKWSSWAPSRRVSLRCLVQWQCGFGLGGRHILKPATAACPSLPPCLCHHGKTAILSCCPGTSQCDNPAHTGNCPSPSSLGTAPTNSRISDQAADPTPCGIWCFLTQQVRICTLSAPHSGFSKALEDEVKVGRMGFFPQQLPSFPSCAASTPTFTQCVGDDSVTSDEGKHLGVPKAQTLPPREMEGERRGIPGAKSKNQVWSLLSGSSGHSKSIFNPLLSSAKTEVKGGLTPGLQPRELREGGQGQKQLVGNGAGAGWKAEKGPQGSTRGSGAAQRDVSPRPGVCSPQVPVQRPRQLAGNTVQPRGASRHSPRKAPRRAPALRIPLSSSKSVFPPPALQRWDSGPPGGRSQENFGGGWLQEEEEGRAPAEGAEGHSCRARSPWEPTIAEGSGGSLTLHQSRPSSRTAEPAAGRGARRSPPRQTGRSWQSCWPSQEPGITLLAVLLPELWKPRGQVSVCPLFLCCRGRRGNGADIQEDCSGASGTLRWQGTPARGVAGALAFSAGGMGRGLPPSTPLTFVQVDVLRGQGTVGQLSPLLQDVVFVIWALPEMCLPHARPGRHSLSLELDVLTPVKSLISCGHSKLCHVHVLPGGGGWWEVRVVGGSTQSRGELGGALTPWISTSCRSIRSLRRETRVGVSLPRRTLPNPAPGLTGPSAQAPTPQTSGRERLPSSGLRRCAAEPRLTSAAALDKQEDEEQKRGQHVAQLLEEVRSAFGDDDVDDAAAARQRGVCWGRAGAAPTEQCTPTGPPQRSRVGLGKGRVAAAPGASPPLTPREVGCCQTRLAVPFPGDVPQAPRAASCTWAGGAAVAGAVARRVPRGRLGGGLGDSQVEDAALVQAAVVVVQVAGVGALVCRLQRVDAQREIAAREGVRPHRHAVAQEGRPVGAALARRVQVEQAVCAVMRHPGRLPVPVHHLLRLLQVPVGPHVRAVHARQQRGRPALHSQHLLLAVPVRAGGPGWGSESVRDPRPGGSQEGGANGREGDTHGHQGGSNGDAGYRCIAPRPSPPPLRTGRKRSRELRGPCPRPRSPQAAAAVPWPVPRMNSEKLPQLEAAAVAGLINALLARRVHVHEPARRATGWAAAEVPVDHALAVVQPVLARPGRRPPSSLRTRTPRSCRRSRAPTALVRRERHWGRGVAQDKTTERLTEFPGRAVTNLRTEGQQSLEGEGDLYIRVTHPDWAPTWFPGSLLQSSLRWC
ncbi:hypothetical protein Cadr_000013045 [Camelus dromedarius]|uniref:Uncharacterized protein n=1 Tax=Camelus dromedarius TaxID=9838 RepID=A0A5N4DDL9_CAMDR|nr:hypothetical protein Cadr_000013045 [Camelus dromedarius]